MWPIERRTAAEYSRIYLSKHKHSRDSAHVEDRVAAELYRIASETYASIEQDMIADRARTLAPGHRDPFEVGGLPVEPAVPGALLDAIDLESYPKTLAARWAAFCADPVVPARRGIVLESGLDGAGHLVRPEGTAPAPEGNPARLGEEALPFLEPGRAEAVLSEMRILLRLATDPASAEEPDPVGSTAPAGPAGGLHRATPEQIEAARSQPRDYHGHALVRASDNARVDYDGRVVGPPVAVPIDPIDPTDQADTDPAVAPTPRPSRGRIPAGARS